MDELKRLVDRWKRTWLEKYFLGDDYGGEKRPNKPLHKDIISSYKSLYSYIDKLPPGSELLFKTLGEPGSEISNMEYLPINYIARNTDLLSYIEFLEGEYSKNDSIFKKQLINLVRLLCYKGSPVTLGTVDNCTPLYYMCKILNNGDIDILQLLVSDINPITLKACKILKIDHKLNRQINWDVTSTDYAVTPLHCMLNGRKSNDRDDCVKLLCKIPIDVNINDKNDDTTLAWPVKCGNVEIVKTLLDHGADPKVQNNSAHSRNHTSFELCIINRFTPHGKLNMTHAEQYDIAKLMLDSQNNHDARQMVNKEINDPRAVGLNEWRPPDMLCSMVSLDEEYFKLFRLLFQYGAEKPSERHLQECQDWYKSKIEGPVKLLMAKKQLSFFDAFFKSEEHLLGDKLMDGSIFEKLNPLNVIDDRISMYSDGEKKEKKESKKAKYKKLMDKAILDKKDLVWDLFIHNERRLKEVNDDLEGDPYNLELRFTQLFLDQNITKSEAYKTVRELLEKYPRNKQLLQAKEYYESRQISRGSKKTKKKKKKKKKKKITNKKKKITNKKKI